MNVLYLINHAGKAGTEKYVYNLVKAYNNKLCNCFFCYNEPGLLLEQMKEENVPIFNLKMKSPFDFHAAKKLAEYCKDKEIDVIHAQYPRENYIAILSKLFFNNKARVVFTSHLTLKTNIIWNITNRFMTPFNHKIISVCNYGKELLIKNGVNKKKIEVIFNAMTYEEKEKSSTIREELSLSDEFLIVTLARYHFSKGLDFLIDSIKELKKIAVKPFKLLIVGDGELWDEITKKIDDDGLRDNILQTGFRKDIDNILNGCDLFVNSASCREALSFAMLEALSKKLPLVATNVGGNPDIVNKETDCGIIVEYGDTVGFANAVNSLMNDSNLYDRMSENAKTAILTRFDYDKMLSKTFEAYK